MQLKISDLCGTREFLRNETLAGYCVVCVQPPHADREGADQVRTGLYYRQDFRCFALRSRDLVSQTFPQLLSPLPPSPQSAPLQFTLTHRLSPSFPPTPHLHQIAPRRRSGDISICGWTARPSYGGNPGEPNLRPEILPDKSFDKFH